MDFSVTISTQKIAFIEFWFDFFQIFPALATDGVVFLKWITMMKVQGSLTSTVTTSNTSSTKISDTFGFISPTLISVFASITGLTWTIAFGEFLQFFINIANGTSLESISSNYLQFSAISTAPRRTSQAIISGKKTSTFSVDNNGRWNRVITFKTVFNTLINFTHLITISHMFG